VFVRSCRIPEHVSGAGGNLGESEVIQIKGKAKIHAVTCNEGTGGNGGLALLFL